MASPEGFHLDDYHVDAPTAEALQAQFGGHWGVHPRFAIADWKAEVENDDTRQGYWDWVVSQIEAQNAV